MNRLPVLQTAGIRTFFNGPESFTPDNRYLLGPAPELEGCFVAAGFNSVGIQSAGGAGKVLAEWIVEGAPPFDLSDVDIRRMAPFQSNRRYLRARVSETLGLLYADHFPHRQYESARGVRHTPFHELMAAEGAQFGETSGWERPHYFGPEPYTAGWQRQPWFARVAAEHRAAREGAALFDLSGFGKIRVEGADAVHVLQRLSAADVDVAPGRIVYTQWLNARGGIEADLTVTRLGETSFLVVTSTATLPRDLAWLRRHIPEDARCAALDVTAGEGVLALMGPKARDILAACTPADLSNAAFPFGTAQVIELGMGLVRAHRVSYVGELGWELYVTADMARHVFGTVREAGRAHALRPAGMHALDSCRIEKAFRHWGHDITDEDHVLEAGLGFAVRTGKADGKFGPFLGREAVLRGRQEGVARRLLQFRLQDPGPLLYHAEPILRAGAVVSRLTSGNYGHWLGAAIGMGYVPVAPGETAEETLAGPWEIEVAGRRIAATASLRPMYDPEGARVRM
jgi:4-methylaminobutanoate oxidase (formaldehyde-forming)